MPDADSQHAQIPHPEPGKRDPEGRRRAMLDAATEIIVRRGAAALTHRAVASLAGVSLGSTTKYFNSIDDLREEALALLAREIEESLIALEASLTDAADIPSVLAKDASDFMRSSRAVKADIALLSSGTTDPQLRPLALMWTDRLIEILTRYIGEERATAVALYIDGVTIHAGLHEQAVSEQTMRSTFRALINYTDIDTDTDTE